MGEYLVDLPNTVELPRAVTDVAQRLDDRRRIERFDLRLGEYAQGHRGLDERRAGTEGPRTAP